MKIVTWNINGIRAVIKKGFKTFLVEHKPDILCLQEIKISESARIKDTEKMGIDFPGYAEFWNSAVRPGYSGTAILVKDDILGKAKVINGTGHPTYDREGRVQTIELPKAYVVNVYFPNANHELSRLKFKLEFNQNLLKHLKKLDQKKPVILCGDYNVAHNEIDLARPQDNIGNPGFTYEERDWMTAFLKAGFVDVFRQIYPRKEQYSWWSYRSGARQRNIGWRIDYVCLSKRLSSKVKKAFILDHVHGSDHCPVGVEVDIDKKL